MLSGLRPPEDGRGHAYLLIQSAPPCRPAHQWNRPPIRLPGPFKRENYIDKFLILTDGILEKKESDRFLKNVQNLKNLKAGQLDKLNIEIKKSKLKRNLKKGIF